MPIAGQTTGPIGLIFLMKIHGWLGSVISYKKFDFFNFLYIFVTVKPLQQDILKS